MAATPPLGAAVTGDVRYARGQRVLDEVCHLAGIEPIRFVHKSGARVAQADSGRDVVRGTTLLLDLLSDVQLRAVFAHEVAHVVLRRDASDGLDEATRGDRRRNEYDADRLAVQWTDDAETLVSALNAVAAFNARREGIRPGGGNSDHPPLWLRIHRIRRLGRTMERERHARVKSHGLRACHAAGL